jgi:predicted short-subunit dehydrogenase-like oxidoreductase (DUF2520 family)
LTAVKHIVLIGAGNVATNLALALYNEGYLISQVYSRTKTSAEILAKKINAKAVTDLKKLNTAAAIYIIALKDDAIEDVAKKIHLTDKIVVHTSGTVSLNVLKGASENYGVFYPLQTFSKGRILDFKKIPICIEANNKATATSLTYFAKSISNEVQKINSEHRKTIHLAAVFACNFSNHMYTIAENILVKNKLSLDLLKPLIEETAEKIKNNSPAKMQTGPAVRGDKKTIKAHLKLLSGQKDKKQLYDLLSKSIIASSKKKK